MREDLITLAQESLESEDLDEIVHELKSGEASTINNGGLPEQVAFLYLSMGLEGARKEILDAIEAKKQSA